MTTTEREREGEREAKLLQLGKEGLYVDVGTRMEGAVMVQEVVVGQLRLRWTVREQVDEFREEA